MGKTKYNIIHVMANGKTRKSLKGVVLTRDSGPGAVQLINIANRVIGEKYGRANSDERTEKNASEVGVNG